MYIRVLCCCESRDVEDFHATGHAGLPFLIKRNCKIISISVYIPLQMFSSTDAHKINKYMASYFRGATVHYGHGPANRLLIIFTFLQMELKVH